MRISMVTSVPFTFLQPNSYHSLSYNQFPTISISYQTNFLRRQFPTKPISYRFNFLQNQFPRASISYQINFLHCHFPTIIQFSNGNIIPLKWQSIFQYLYSRKFITVLCLVYINPPGMAFLPRTPAMLEKLGFIVYS